MISLIYSIIPVLCFGIGLFVGYKIKKPDIKNPVTIIKEKIAEHKEQKELIKENEYWEDVFNNLENYDGTAQSQKEVRNVNNEV